MNEFKLIENYQKKAARVNKFFDFMGTVFPSISFNEWYKQGYWGESYVPFSFVDNDKIISNVSVAELDLIINGETKKGIQIGAVGTLPEFRNRGLSKQLMDAVINKYKNKVDLMFLFANDTVLDFYPKFGFRRVTETKYEKNITKITNSTSVRKLNLKDEVDKNLFSSILEKRIPPTEKFGAVDYQWITMWHVINFYSDSIYYFEEFEAIIIAEKNDTTIDIIEVFSTNYFDLDRLLTSDLISDSINKVVFYFTPDKYDFSYDIEITDSSMLFVKGEFLNKNDKLKFPLTSAT